jgi:hypothetical protein
LMSKATPRQLALFYISTSSGPRHHPDAGGTRKLALFRILGLGRPPGSRHCQGVRIANGGIGHRPLPFVVCPPFFALPLVRILSSCANSGSTET